MCRPSTPSPSLPSHSLDDSGSSASSPCGHAEAAAGAAGAVAAAVAAALCRASEDPLEAEVRQMAVRLQQLQQRRWDRRRASGQRPAPVGAGDGAGRARAPGVADGGMMDAIRALMDGMPPPGAAKGGPGGREGAAGQDPGRGRAGARAAPLRCVRYNEEFGA